MKNDADKFRAKVNKHGFLIGITLLAALTAFEASASVREPAKCTPMIVKGKLYTEGGIIVPSCGILIGSVDKNKAGL